VPRKQAAALIFSTMIDLFAVSIVNCSQIQYVETKTENNSAQFNKKDLIDFPCPVPSPCFL